MNGEFYNSDCMDGMKDYEDNHFDLAIVDPPYAHTYSSNGIFSGGRSRSECDLASQSFNNGNPRY